ncbi:LysR substrate-binding domain-containing protein [Paraburkholderia youngii]|uniref:LysR substrate-binding domain-containing protein n=1 Tax=Paraburkholderia youngii TaxID=2782701 RepID=UPI003D1BE75A
MGTVRGRRLDVNDDPRLQVNQTIGRVGEERQATLGGCPARGDVNGGLALREAALAKLGVIFQPQVMLQEDLDAGRPIRLFPDWPAQTWPVHVVHLPDAHMPPKLASFIAFLQETLGHDSQP